MSKNKKNYLWLIILLLVIVALFIIISKKEVLEQEEGEEIETEILQIDKNKKSEGEVTKENLENLINQLKGNTETPSE